MTIAPPEVRAAKALLAQHRKDGRGKRAPKTPHVNQQARVRDVLYLAWIRRQPCAAVSLGACAGAIEAAHVRFSDASAGRVNPGMQRKPDDAYTVPLCAAHHREGPKAQHRGDERKFWEGMSINPGDLMRDLRGRYLEEPSHG